MKTSSCPNVAFLAREKHTRGKSIRPSRPAKYLQPMLGKKFELGKHRIFRELQSVASSSRPSIIPPIAHEQAAPHGRRVFNPLIFPRGNSVAAIWACRRPWTAVACCRFSEPQPAAALSPSPATYEFLLQNIIPTFFILTHFKKQIILLNTYPTMENETITFTTKGQVVIPAALRRNSALRMAPRPR